MRPSLVVLLVVAACGDDAADTIDYEGEPGTPVIAEFDGLVPTVIARIDGSEERTMLVDTGAPLTIADATAFPALDEGRNVSEIEAFGLTIHDYPVARWDVFAGTPGDPTVLDGILGGDLLRFFAFSLDYKGGRAWLDDAFDPAVAPADLGAGASVDVPVRVTGGGLSLLPGDCSQSGCGTIELPATRVILQATFEEQAAPVWVLVDSGASAVVLDDAYYTELGGDTGGRPRLDGVPVGTVNGTVEAFLSRVWRVRLEGLAEADPEVEQDDVPVLVIPGTSLLLGLSAEVGVEVQALIGGSFLRRYATTFDYPERRLRLARYDDQSHVPANEFVGVGFEMSPFGAEWVVEVVYPGTDAALEGIGQGDVVAELGGTAIMGMDADAVYGLFGNYALGEEVPVGIQGPGAVETKMVLVEDLLPSFPAP